MMNISMIIIKQLLFTVYTVDKTQISVQLLFYVYVYYSQQQQGSFVRYTIAITLLIATRGR